MPEGDRGCDHPLDLSAERFKLRHFLGTFGEIPIAIGRDENIVFHPNADAVPAQSARFHRSSDLHRNLDI